MPDQESLKQIGIWIGTIVTAVFGYLKFSKWINSRKDKPEFIGQITGDYGKVFDRQEAEIAALRARVVALETAVDRCEKRERKSDRVIALLTARIAAMEKKNGG